MSAEIVLTSITTILVALIGGGFALQTHKRNKEYENSKAAEELREKEAKYQMEMQFAAIQLAIVTAAKLHDVKIELNGELKKVNGELTEAITEANAVKEEYRKFIRGEHVKHIVD